MKNPVSLIQTELITILQYIYLLKDCYDFLEQNIVYKLISPASAKDSNP